MTDVWSERAQAYRDSEAHKQGRDLDLIVEWSTGFETALDVATGGGHVARRLREAGLKVVTTDAAPGMEPDVVGNGAGNGGGNGSPPTTSTTSRWRCGRWPGWPAAAC